MRVTDVFLAFPPLLLALALAAVLPAEPDQPDHRDRGQLVALVRAADPRPGRVGGPPAATSRAAARSALRGWRIIFRHILPNAITPVLVQVSLDFGGVILTAAALSFLGLGAQDPTPDWGLMVAEGQSYFTRTGGWSRSPAWRSCSPRSRSTCSATACATCSTRGGCVLR